MIRIEKKKRERESPLGHVTCNQRLNLLISWKIKSVLFRIPYKMSNTLFINTAQNSSITKSLSAEKQFISFFEFVLKISNFPIINTKNSNSIVLTAIN